MKAEDKVFLWLLFILLLQCSCSAKVEVPKAYLDTCYPAHCKIGDRACDCLAESVACNKKLNTQIATIRGLNE